MNDKGNNYIWYGCHSVTALPKNNQKGDFFDRIHDGEPFSICYHLEYNTWQGKTNLQLNVKDIKFAEEL